MFKNVREVLKIHVEKNIFPLYDTVDKGHNRNHIIDVINSSEKILKIMGVRNVNPEILYIAAAYHDIGLTMGDRKVHHLNSYKYVMEDIFLKEYFNEEEILIIATACKEHRASNKRSTTSIYSDILSDADRCGSLKIEDMIRRSYEYTAKTQKDPEKIFNDVYTHLLMKYGDRGYAKLNLAVSNKAFKDILDNSRKCLRDKELFKEKYAIVVGELQSVKESVLVMDSKTYVPIYIILTTTGTTLSNLVKKVTKTEYTHSSISFDLSLDNVYSYGKNDEGVAGFGLESKNVAFANFEEVPCKILMVMVPDTVRNRGQLMIAEMMSRRKKLQFNIAGIFGIYFNKAINRTNKMFCSQFVDSFFKSLGVDLTTKDSGLVHPIDFDTIKYKDKHVVYEGNIKSYNQAEAEKNAKKIIDRYNKMSVNESYKYLNPWKALHEGVSPKSHNTLYHLSERNLDGNILNPRIPSNYMTNNGFEENITPRVSFSTSINGCLRAMSMNLKDKELYVHKAVGKYDHKKISNREVPDQSITKEIWVTSNVKIECIGKIKIGEAKDKELKYTYGKHTAELYDWDWEWSDKYVTESTILNEANKFPIQFEEDGSVLIKKLKRLDFEKEYQNSHKLLLSYHKSNNIEPMKYELAKLWLFNMTLEEKIYIKQPKEDVRKNYINTRARVLNDFNKYLKIVLESEPHFNFSEYYESSPFNKEYYKVTKDSVKGIRKFIGALAFGK